MEPPTLNPYEAPANNQTEPAVPTTLAYQFRDMKAFAWVTGLCISFHIPYAILITLLLKQVITLPDEMLDLIDGLYAIAFIVGVVFYCMWKYRCACNARYFYGGPLLYTPGWCVGYYFIPILMLFRPYQCMKDIFEKTYLVFGQKAPTSLLLVWWLAWIATTLFDNFSARSEDPSVLLTSQLVALPSVFLVLWVLFTLTRRQYEIITDAELAAKIGTIDPYKSFVQKIPVIPLQKPPMPPSMVSPSSTPPEQE
jgi:hypothetical protein